MFFYLGNTRKFALFIFFIFAIPALVTAQPDLSTLIKNNNITNFYAIKEKARDHWAGLEPSKTNGYKQYKRWEWFWETRIKSNGEFPNVMEIKREVDKYFAKYDFTKNPTLSSEWNLIGPINPVSGDDNRGGIGRINVIRFHPENQNEFWIGAASGGVWRTVDAGKNWTPFPFTQFLSIGVSDIAFSKSNPNVVYVATGDANGNASTAGNFYSIGVIKTTNGGQSWDVTDLSYQLAGRMLVGRVLVDPRDENIVYAGTSSGIYKTTDGGEEWTRVSDPYYIKDMEFKPGDPDVIYAASYVRYQGAAKIIVSHDAGEKWDIKVSEEEICRFALAVSPNDPNLVFAVAADDADDAKFHSFWVSEDSGEEFYISADFQGIGNILGRGNGTTNDLSGQGWYDLCIASNPNFYSEIYVGGINVFKDLGAGSNFDQKVADWRGANGAPYVHADHHDLQFHPTLKNVLFSANDGGLVYTTDGGANWRDISDGLSITQFYKFSNSQTNPDKIIGGTQDNGTMFKSGSKWDESLGGDGADCLINPKDPNYVYASIVRGNILRSTNGGKNFRNALNRNRTGIEGAWITPMAIDPSNPSNIYAGYNDIWYSFNHGESWKAISAFGFSYPHFRFVTVAPSKSGTVYAATSSRVYGTYNNGDSWDENVFSSTEPITGIAVDPENHKRIWVTLGGFSETQKVYEINDGEVTNLTGNLPNVPINCIVYQAASPDRIYIGTDIGVFFSDYNSAVWTPFGSGLPNVIVSDMEIIRSEGKLRIATYGRGIWETSLNFCKMEEPKMNLEGRIVICPGDSLILEAETNYQNIEWSTGETGNSIVVKEPGFYSYKVSEGDCFAHSKPLNVDQFNVRDVRIDPQEGWPICDQDEINVTLKAFPTLGFRSYEWSNGNDAKEITVTEPGLYWVKATSSDGCSSFSDTINIKLWTTPEKPVIVKTDENTLKASEEAYAYQWYLDEEPIPGAVEQTYKYTDPGVYQVEITNEGECSNISEGYPVAESVVDYQVGEGIYVSPNPSDGLYNIEIETPIQGRLQISVTDVSGREINGFETMTNGEITRKLIDLESQPVGTYYLTIKSDYRFWKIKLIKN